MEPGPVKGRRRGVQWHRVGHGLHRPAADDSLMTTLATWQLALPASGRFTHLTGAASHGWWLPPLPPGLPVFASMLDNESRPQRNGLRASRHATVPEPWVLEGVRVDPPAEVLLSCARHLSLLDLVVLMDAALYMEAVSLVELEAAVARRRRGAPQLRRALAFCDGRSESAWETLLRELHRMCGIDVEPQHPLLDDTGAEVARADLWVVGTNALHEYDGEHHLAKARQRKDLARARRITNVDWVRRGYTSAEVLHQAIGILRDADLSLGREHRPERVRAWYALLSDSCFTPAGQQRLLSVLGLPPTGDARQRITA